MDTDPRAGKSKASDTAARMTRSTTPILGVVAFVGLITGCGGRAGAPNTPPLVAPQAASQQDKPSAIVSSPALSSYTSLYSFKGGADGAHPSAGLIALNGTFYGTTSGGGTNGNGTVFEVCPSGAERVLYSSEIYS